MIPPTGTPAGTEPARVRKARVRPGRVRKARVRPGRVPPARLPPGRLTPGRLTPGRVPRAAPLLAGLALAGLLAGCGAPGAARSPTTPGAAGQPGAPVGGSPAGSGRLAGTVTVLAAASLSGPFTELGRRFSAAHPGTAVRFSFGASSTLAQQVIAGAPADVFASASPANMAQVTSAGQAAGPRTFAANEAEIAVAPRSTSKVAGLADLGRPGVTVALCQPQVPCGAVARAVLARAGVPVHPVTEGLDVKATLAYVTGGQVDAAVVYATDVQAAGGQVRGVPIAAPDNQRTDYPIAVLRGSRNDAAAQAFVALVLSPEGQDVLARAGFLRP